MGTFFGWLFICGTVLTRLASTVYSLVKYSDLPAERKKNSYSLVAMVFVPFIVNLLYFLVPLMMMICIPHFSWWMGIVFFFLLSPYCCWIPYSLAPAACASVLLVFVGKEETVGGAVLITAIMAVVGSEFLFWLLKRWRKKLEAANAEAASESDASQSK